VDEWKPLPSTGSEKATMARNSVRQGTVETVSSLKLHSVDLIQFKRNRLEHVMKKRQRDASAYTSEGGTRLCPWAPW
jgi:hypothetical protein